MKDSSFLVRISKQDHEKFKRALALYGGSQSATAEKLVIDWSNKVLMEAGTVYGFKRGDDYVSFFRLDKAGNVERVEFGKPVALQMTSVVTREYLEELAAKLDCKLVRLD